MWEGKIRLYINIKTKSKLAHLGHCMSSSKYAFLLKLCLLFVCFLTLFNREVVIVTNVWTTHHGCLVIKNIPLALWLFEFAGIEMMGISLCIYCVAITFKLNNFRIIHLIKYFVKTLPNRQECIFDSSMLFFQMLISVPRALDLLILNAADGVTDSHTRVTKIWPKTFLKPLRLFLLPCKHWNFLLQMP